MSNLGMNIYEANAETRSKLRQYNSSDSISDESSEGSSSKDSDYESKKRARLDTLEIPGQAAPKNTPSSMFRSSREIVVSNPLKQYLSIGIFSIFPFQKNKKQVRNEKILIPLDFPLKKSGKAFTMASTSTRTLRRRWNLYQSECNFDP